MLHGFCGDNETEEDARRRILVEAEQRINQTGSIRFHLSDELTLYMSEREDGPVLEPVGIFFTREAAEKSLEGDPGLVSEMKVGEGHLEGIGSCPHWHINQPPEEGTDHEPTDVR